MDLLVLRAILETQVLKATQAQLVNKVMQVVKAHKDLRDLKATQETPVQKVQPVPKVTRVPMVLRATQVQLVIKGRRGLMEIQATLAQKAYSVFSMKLPKISAGAVAAHSGGKETVLDRFQQETEASLAAPASAKQRLHDAFISGQTPKAAAAPGPDSLQPTPGRGAAAPGAPAAIPGGPASTVLKFDAQGNPVQ